MDASLEEIAIENKVLILGASDAVLPSDVLAGLAQHINSLFLSRQIGRAVAQLGRASESA